MNPALTIVAEARTYIGVRWLHQGRSREGVDCVGLPVVCLRKIGVELDFTGYTAVSKDEEMLDLCRAHLLPIALAAAAPGDVVVIGFEKQRHMAIVGDHPHGLSLIHAFLPNRQVIEARLDSQWSEKIIAAFRFKEVAQWQA
jgi:cell wall-associated NlpC family hydrolase